MFNVLAKTLRDKRFFILGWSFGLAFLGFAMVSFFPSFGGDQITGFLEAMPAALQGMIGDMQDWKDLPSYIGSQIFDIRLSIIITIMAIILAIGLTVGEEDKRQLQTLTALPISRTKIAFAKWLAVVLISGFAVLATALGAEVGLLVINESLDQMVLVRLVLSTWLMVSALVTVILALGLATGKRAITTVAALIITVGSFLLTTFSQSVDWLEKFSPASFFHYFPAAEIARGTVRWEDAVVYAGLIVLSLVVTFIVFPRRDIKS